MHVVQRLARRLIPAHAGKTKGQVEYRSAVTAHPRSRGENASRRSAVLSPAGSSPLTRGKLRAKPPRGSDQRLIPAHAGKTSARSTRKQTGQAHPRSRGENSILSPALERSAGSSPLTRGKPDVGQAPTQEPRLIPAHAGKTPRRPPRQGPHTAHPRSRGENLWRSHASLIIIGSSPLTRGKPRRTDVHTIPRRLIPAHAGKTRPASGTGRSGAAHPRSRGENFRRGECCPGRGGSSPLTRGKPYSDSAGEPRSRLIPAHAGKTASFCLNRSMLTAHPRSRGENVVRYNPVIPLDGSSPLTRGKPPSSFRLSLASRLIPAHAGKTWSATERYPSRTAHPRSRGENLVEEVPDDG